MPQIVVDVPEEIARAIMQRGDALDAFLVCAARDSLEGRQPPAPQDGAAGGVPEPYLRQVEQQRNDALNLMAAANVEMMRLRGENSALAERVAGFQLALRNQNAGA
jgi:hypothetical protein